MDGFLCLLCYIDLASIWPILASYNYERPFTSLAIATILALVAQLIVGAYNMTTSCEHLKQGMGYLLVEGRPRPPDTDPLLIKAKRHTHLAYCPDCKMVCLGSSGWTAPTLRQIDLIRKYHPALLD